MGVLERLILLEVKMSVVFVSSSRPSAIFYVLHDSTTA